MEEQISQSCGMNIKSAEDFGANADKPLKGRITVMKILKILSVWTLVIILFSSSYCVSNHDPEFVVYNLGLSFQDVSGKDLVKGIGLEEWSAGTSMEGATWGSVNADLYVLDIIFSEPCENWDNKIYNSPARPGFIPDVNRPKFLMDIYNGNCHLTNSFAYPADDCPEQKMLTYKLKIPYVFGDEAVHELVTYWDIPNKKSSLNSYAKCNRIVFEGNEIIPQALTDKYGNYVAKIVLNPIE